MYVQVKPDIYLSFFRYYRGQDTIMFFIHRLVNLCLLLGIVFL